MTIWKELLNALMIFSMSKAPIIETERLLLRPISIEFCSDNYVSWLNDKDVYRFLESGGDYTIERLKFFLTETEIKDIFFWAISIKQNHKHIGNIKIDPINERNGLGEYGILMGDKTEWGKGYAKEASIAIINYCFNKYNLRKITLGVIEENISAVRLYENLGFKREGLFIEHGIYDGKYRNAIRMALFNDKYNENFK